SAPAIARNSFQEAAMSAPVADGGGGISEAFRNSRDLQWMRSILPWSFAAEPWPGENLGRIGQLLGVKGAAYTLHRFQVRLRVHLRHHLFLFSPPAMCACGGTASLDAQFEDPVSQGLRGMLLPLDPAIVKHQRMQVAVAGVKNVGHPDACLSAKP